MRSNRIPERFSGGRSIPPPAHPQRSTRNQSLRGPDARDTIGLPLLPQLEGESVSEFCLPPASGKPSARQAVFDLIGGNASLKREGHARGFIHPKFDGGEEAVGLVVGKRVRQCRRVKLRRRRRVASGDFVTRR